MGKGAVRTHLDPPAVFLLIGRISRTVLPVIQGTIAKKAVHFLTPFVTGIILTRSVFKISAGLFHLRFLFLQKEFLRERLQKRRKIRKAFQVIRCIRHLAEAVC